MAWSPIMNSAHMEIPGSTSKKIETPDAPVCSSLPTVTVSSVITAGEEDVAGAFDDAIEFAGAGEHVGFRQTAFP